MFLGALVGGAWYYLSGRHQLVAVRGAGSTGRASPRAGGRHSRKSPARGAASGPLHAQLEQGEESDRKWMTRNPLKARAEL